MNNNDDDDDTVATNNIMKIQSHNIISSAEYCTLIFAIYV